MKQHELIKQITDQELKRSLILSQLILLILAFVFSLFFFQDITDWIHYFNWKFNEILVYGVVSGLVIVTIDVFLIRVFPSRYYDDGGINKRIFSSLSLYEIFYITLLIAISEELLFRGVLQTTFGYFIASIVFALVHFRYLKKPVLLIAILLVSFFIGFLFVITENLYVTITTHFIIDFLLGLFIRYQGWREKR